MTFSCDLCINSQVNVPKLIKCHNCRLLIIHIKGHNDDSFFVDYYDPEKYYCFGCFEYMNFSFLFDSDKEIKNDSRIRCLNCNHLFKLNSLERYQDFFKNKEYIYLSKICSVKCIRELETYTASTKNAKRKTHENT